MKFIILTFLLILTLNAKDVRLEILGSGGPEIDGRASASYIVWVDNKAELIVDMGSGSMLRFEESGAKLKDLDAVVLTHLHIDHCVDLPSYIKAGYFTNRVKSLEIIGPFANKHFPSVSEYLDGLFGKNGVYKYMNDVLSENSDSFQILPVEVQEDKILVKKYENFKLTLISVHHGMVPAVALRIDVDGKSIVISGDTNNKDNHLEMISKDADLFIVHHAITQDASGYATHLHVKPLGIANVAQKSNVKKVVLSHRMKRTILKEADSLKIIKDVFKGEVVFAEDRMVLKL